VENKKTSTEGIPSNQEGTEGKEGALLVVGAWFGVEDAGNATAEMI
jgi:hypothetical protein